MLIWFRYKAKNIATTAISVFVCSWLLFLCQTCFAANDDIKSRSESSTDAPISCHTPENIALEQSSTGDDEHCIGTCDCDALTFTVSSDKSSELKEKTKYSADLFAYITPDLIISTRAPPNYQISTTPERAILLPLHTYNVLLI